MQKTPSILLSKSERAALAQLARGTNRIAYRARGVLLLADGLSRAAVAAQRWAGVFLRTSPMEPTV